MNDENYTPYGDEWKKEAMKNRKADIVGMLRKSCMEREILQQWKDEAMTVLGEWETTWTAAGSPGRLGQSKALALREFILENSKLSQPPNPHNDET